MSAADSVRRRHSFITAQVQRFRENRNPLALVHALILVLKQRRTLELIYGAYCHLFHRPSVVRAERDEEALISVLRQSSARIAFRTLSRTQLLELYGRDFCVRELPDDFQGARCESICQGVGFLLIGEYGEDSRLAYVTPRACVVSDAYRRVPGVRHIHSIVWGETAGEFFVSTGDTRKLLDLWTVADGGLRFVRRVRHRLAGFMAAARVSGEYYFGTDFSGRPNYIETMGGSKYFFPAKANRLFVAAFKVFFGRYLVSINTELEVVGGRKALSIFDTHERRFLYCEYWVAAASQPVRRVSRAA
jgi:hypothetical protein